MEWISVKDRLPEFVKNNSVCIIAAWGNLPENVAEMKYCREVVSSHVVDRFKWQGRLSPWKVTHWQPMPEPPEKI